MGCSISLKGPVIVVCIIMIYLIWHTMGCSISLKGPVIVVLHHNDTFSMSACIKTPPVSTIRRDARWELTSTGWLVMFNCISVSAGAVGTGLLCVCVCVCVWAEDECFLFILLHKYPTASEEITLCGERSRFMISLFLTFCLLLMFLFKSYSLCIQLSTSCNLSKANYIYIYVNVCVLTCTNTFIFSVDLNILV